MAIWSSKVYCGHPKLEMKTPLHTKSRFVAAHPKEVGPLNENTWPGDHGSSMDEDLVGWKTNDFKDWKASKWENMCEVHT